MLYSYVNTRVNVQFKQCEAVWSVMTKDEVSASNVDDILKSEVSSEVEPARKVLEQVGKYG